HDRYFLERVCNEIIELDNKTLYRYKGNYSYFLEKKQERIEIFEANVDKAQNLYRKELEWMRRMPKARGTKAISRAGAVYQSEKTAQPRLEMRKVDIQVNVSRLGSKILELHHLKKSFGNLKILDDFNYVFKKNERIGIVGKNGVGKTTFLDIIMEKQPVDAGKVSVGETVVFGYYTQSGINLKDDKKVIEVIKDIAEYIPLTKGKTLSAAQLLEKFLFTRDMHYNFVEKLSGGEKRRLYLLTILMKNPNFLILDEPTNDLDIVTLNVLEDFLEDFQGCLIVVTHDRYFMDKLVDHLFVFEGNGKIIDYIGRYSDYRLELKEREALEKEAEKQKNVTQTVVEQPKQEQPKTKLSFKEKFELEQLEKELPQLEEQKEKLIAQLADSSTNHEELVKLTQKLGFVTKQLDEKTDRWLILSEIEG
ncbi:MAG: ATP-binding cassette domain-containing protein, partial [Flavobacteriales bacterium]|nr:ATP-binding cassette domain-containing protein [Flavobacteriales bacterium]